jgi:pSer/pThr/pTyr-binding forkhead associated (FHA) protein
MKVTLTIHSVEGARAVELSNARLTFGRTDAADLVINGQSLSRVHASINRDGDRVWIIDEGSTNGTLVNGESVPPNGLPLHHGDEVYLGETTIVVEFAQEFTNDVLSAAAPPAVARRSGLPVPIIAASAALIILFAAIVIVLAYRNRSEKETITVRPYTGQSDQNQQSSDSTSANSPVPGSNGTDPPAQIDNDSSSVRSNAGPTKRYLSMSPDEQRQFVANEAQHVARMIGNREGYAFTPEVVNKIKIWVDAYAHRLNSPKPSGGGCNMHHDLTTLLNRARVNAPLVVKAFNEKGLSPQVGLYLAMIEAEYCPCLSSGTGPKGYFQFASSTARRYGVQDVSSPKDTRPDDRCKIDTMAPVAAQYMKDLIAMFGTGPLSVPLAVASYNEGEGGLSTNLMKALNAARSSDNPERSFWTMVAHEEMMSDQFQRENIKYVPHFFGAAIIGENPRVFGVDMEPISSYTQQNNATTAQN